MLRNIIYGIILSTFICSAAEAAVEIKISAVNPLKKKADVPIKYYLPKEVKPEDIIEKGKFSVEFDKEKDCYFVQQNITLKPKQAVLFKLAVKDVWVIPEAIVAQKKQVIALFNVDLLNRRKQQTINKLKDEITRELHEITQRQSNNTIAKVGVESHIQAYGQNIKVLAQIENDIAMFRNLLASKE